MICSSDCADGTEIPQLPNVCGDITVRDEMPSKLVIWRCDVDLPTGSDDAIATALEAMIAVKTLGAVGKLRNFKFGDPETTEVSRADCLPAIPIVTGRTLSFEDFNAYEIDDAGSASPYYDRDIYASLVVGAKYNFGRTTCDGKLYPFLTPDGTQFMTGILTVFSTDDDTVANLRTEVKKGQVKFLGDPLARFPKPLIDLSTQIVAHPTLKALY